MLQKQIDMIKKIKEEEKKDYETKIEKIKMELEMLKVKYLNNKIEDDNLILKYKNIIKSIGNQCKAKGIKLSMNF